MPNYPNALVAMTHAASADEEPATTTRAAYDAVWKDKGWKLVGSVDGLGNIVSAGTSKKES